MKQQSTRILVIDDDEDVRELLKEYLLKNKFDPIVLADGTHIIEILQTESIELIILDIMLPDMDGYAICKLIRAQSQIPIIMLTAVSEETDRIIGLELGADDYLTKPFNPRELLARIRAILRRTNNQVPLNPEGEIIYSFANWILNETKRTLYSPENVVIPISSGEYDLLYVFLTKPGRVLNRDSLIELTKNRESTPFDRSIDIIVSRLRQKLEANPKEHILIKTIRNGGYMFTEKVTREVR